MIPTPVLVVEPSLGDVLMLVPVLSALGFQITATESFEEAKRGLRLPPRLLVTEVRLGEFNGLHLVLRGLSARDDMSAIVTSTVDDPVIRAEAEAMGATFVLKPSTPDELKAAIIRTVLRDAKAATAPIRAPFERRSASRRALEPGFVVPDRRRSERRSDARIRIERLTTH